MKDYRQLCAKRKKQASFYYLSRIIGSCINKQGSKNTFNKYFVKEQLISDYFDHRKKKIDFHGLDKILCNFNLEMLKKKSEETLLEEFKTQARKNVAEQEFNEDAFNPKKSTFGILSQCIVAACQYLQNKYQDKQITDLNDAALHWLKDLENNLTFDSNDIETVQTNRNKYVSEIDQLPGYGRALSQDFFKDMGFDAFAKPDIHIKDVVRRLNIQLYSIWGDTIEEQIIRLFDEIAVAASTKKNPVTPNQIDKTIWLWKSGRFYDHFEKNESFALDNEKVREEGFARGQYTQERCNEILKKLKQYKNTNQ